MLGACAVLFRADAAKALVDWTKSNEWRGDTGATIEQPEQKKAGDTFIGEVLTTLGFSIWTHNPSIVDHIGTDQSTLGRECRRYGKHPRQRSEYAKHIHTLFAENPWSQRVAARPFVGIPPQLASDISKSIEIYFRKAQE